MAGVRCGAGDDPLEERCGDLARVRVSGHRHGTRGSWPGRLERLPGESVVVSGRRPARRAKIAAGAGAVNLTGETSGLEAQASLRPRTPLPMRLERCI